MDAYREFPSEFEPAAVEAAAQDPTVVPIGTDERRMQVRAYNYWASLLDGRDYPSIEDLEPADLSDFAPHSVLLDFTGGHENPAMPYIGAAIRDECDLPADVESIDEVPTRSLLSRLTDHYLQIIANRAPVGFEAEFDNQRDETICYRGILMPFSSDGDTIDFIYGVINWKKSDAPTAAQGAPPVVATPIEDESIEPFQLLAISDPQQGEVESFADFELEEDAALADRLSAARECAEAVRQCQARSRVALYRALSQAYDFALAAKAEPDDYAELLAESGVRAQARAPMTPIVKLVFGIDHDKARLTEYAAALSHAERQHVARGGFLAFIEAQAGGLKALVAAERQARRPEPKSDTRTDKARERLRAARPVALDAICSDEEFALVLTRRSGAGVHEAIAVVEDASLVDRAIRSVGA